MAINCNKKELIVYDVEDYTGEKTIHLCVNKESAIQAHLMHYRLLYINGWIKVTGTRKLKDVKNRNEVCWDAYYCLAAVTEYVGNKS